MNPAVRTVLTILWPAFVMAGVLEAVVFLVVDPADLYGVGGMFIGWPAVAVLSVSFVLFWAVIAMASAISVWLSTASRDPVQRGRHRDDPSVLP